MVPIHSSFHYSSNVKHFDGIEHAARIFLSPLSHNHNNFIHFIQLCNKIPIRIGTESCSTNLHQFLKLTLSKFHSLRILVSQEIQDVRGISCSKRSILRTTGKFNCFNSSNLELNCGESINLLGFQMWLNLVSTNRKWLELRHISQIIKSTIQESIDVSNQFFVRHDIFL